MSSKNKKAEQEKLDDIYEALDNGNFSLAERMCRKPDMKNHRIVRSLLAYACACQNRSNEALEIARKVIHECPGDIWVANTISHALKVCRADNDLISLFESVLQYHPSNDAVAIDLFFAYNRVDNFKSMQLLAQKMFKLTNESKFVFWTITSMLLQSDLPKAMLTVGQKMIEKVLQSKSIMLGAEELEIYTLVIRKQELDGSENSKVNEALEAVNKNLLLPCQSIEDGKDFIQSPNKLQLENLRKISLRLELLELLLPVREDEYFEVLMSALFHYPDQWNFHICILNNVNSTQHLQQYDKFLQLTMKKHPEYRSPYIAQIKMNELKKNLVCVELQSIDYLELIICYLDKFCGKQCCFSDIKSYFKSLPLQSLLLLISTSADKMKHIEMEIDSMLNDSLISRESLLITACKFCKYGQVYIYCHELLFSSDYRSKDMEKISVPSPSFSKSLLLTLFEKIKIACKGGAGDEREVQSVDEILLLISSIYRVELRKVIATSDCSRTEHFYWAFEWAVFLLFAIEKLPYSFALKIELLEPLRVLGCGELAFRTFKDLGTKFVQHDSLSFLILPILWENALFDELACQFKNIKAFHESSHRETLDQMSKCFKMNNYAMIMELRRFLKLCSQSSQLAIAENESELLQLIKSFHAIEDCSLHLKDSSFKLCEEELFTNNYDYQLIVRLDADDVLETQEANDRIQSYYSRIKWSKCILKFLKFYFLKDITNTQIYLEELKTLKRHHNTFSDFYPWIQSIGDREFSLISSEYLLQFCELAFKLLTQNRKEASDLLKVCIHNLQELSIILGLKKVNQKSVTYIIDDNLINPLWIRNASSCVQEFIPIYSLLLQENKLHIPELQEVFYIFLEAFSTLLTNLVSKLNDSKYSFSIPRNETSNFAIILEPMALDNTFSEQLQNHLYSSNQLSLKNLLEIVNSKIMTHN